MGYAVELYFDRKTTEKIIELTATIYNTWSGADLIGMGFQPHISLAGYDQVDERALQPILQQFAAQTPPFEIKLDAVGIFPTTQGVVYLGPVVTEHLLRLHREFSAQTTAAGQEAHFYYRPGNWIPHCTVAHDLASEQIPVAVQLCLHSEVFGTGRLVAIGLIEYRPVRQVCRFPLEGVLGAT
jgi:2'-5' RNA ligase